jgi:transposase InsO family protein
MNLGARRIQNELVYQHYLNLSISTIQKVLNRHKVKPLIKPKREKKYKSYQKEIPGERIQIDTCKIRPGIYQYTAVDDCTRYLVAEIYSRRTADNTLLFLDKIVEEMHFPIQRIQSDRGTEFFAYKVQERLFEWGIKFRPSRPASPHLNGKVERVQKTMLIEFYATVNMEDADLSLRLAEWVHFYNWFRVHGSIGMSPIQKLTLLSAKTPYWEEMEPLFIPEKEYIKAQSYLGDLSIKKLKRCL